MPGPFNDKIKCTKCGRTLAPAQFFTEKDGQRMDICKKCLTMHIKNDDPETFKWILEKADVPYISTEWNAIVEKELVKKGFLKSDSVIGKYLSRMKLVQFKNYGYKDTEMLEAENVKKLEEVRKVAELRSKNAREDFEKGLISEAEYKTLISVAELEKEQKSRRLTASVNFAANPSNALSSEFIPDAVKNSAAVHGGLFPEENFLKEEEIPDPAAQLTQEDKIFLAVKWGRLYQPDEWIVLEQYYTDMKMDFDVKDADTEHTLKLLSTLYLKMKIALDSNDADTFSKLQRSYDALRKSAKLTAAQRDNTSGHIDSVGAIVDLCERDGFIPKYVPDDAYPQDKIDYTLADMKEYTRKLVSEDLGLGNQLEIFLKKLENKADGGLDLMSQDDETIDITTEDIEEYREAVDKDIEKDILEQIGHDMDGIYDDEEEY